MAHLAQRFLVVAGLVAALTQAWGFSLRGPAAAWMTPRLGYNLNNDPLFGPMILTEEYRFNTPVLYYGFTPSFMGFFGEKGASEIDKAFKILNDLPTMSDSSSNDTWEEQLKDYPLTATRVNHRAIALGILDLKSTALGSMLESMGLADPTRFVYTLRNRWTTPATTNYHIIRRNYDPDTWQPSSYINGTLWTYPLVTDVNDGSQSFVFTEPVDPLAYFGLFSFPVSGWLVNQLPGMYFTRLTRDDAGGLYYLYRKGNYNVEVPTPSATGGGGPYGSPGGTNTGTNATGTNVAVQLVTTAARGGRGKIQFRRRDYDPLLGFFTGFTNQYTDTYITNGMAFDQYLERPVLSPDILFDAADLQGGDANQPIIFGSFGYQAWVSSVGGTNGVGTNASAGLILGPGIIPAGNGGPSFTLTFNTVNEIFINTFPIDNQDELTASRVLIFGSFDGTTNEPVVYPVGRDLREVEQQVLEWDRDNSWVYGPP